MRTLHLAVEPWSPGLDVDMPYSQILDMPVELGLKLVAIVGPDGMDPEGEFLDHMINKLDCCLLIMVLIDLPSPYANGIVYGRILEALDPLPTRGFECQEFDIHLDMMTRNLFLIAVSLNSAPFGIPAAGD